MFEQYVHYGKKVWVRNDLKGKHREYCLCWHCKRFNPNEVRKNCSIAKTLYDLCVHYNLVTPVWECKKFESK